MENERYLYSVNPKKTIKFLKGTIPIRAPKSLYLDKDEVRECLKYGSIYRRFANESVNIKVTTANLDRLHNAKYMSEEEFKKFLEDKLSEDRVKTISEEENELLEDIESDNNPNVFIPIDEIKEESTIDVDTIEAVEEVVESVEESSPVEYTDYDAETEVKVEETENTGEPVVNEAVESSPVEAPYTVRNNQYNGNKNYNGKKKHH
jgi:hypothetical protein